MFGTTGEGKDVRGGRNQWDGACGPQSRQPRLPGGGGRTQARVLSGTGSPRRLPGRHSAYTPTPLAQQGIRLVDLLDTRGPRAVFGR